MLNNPTIRKTCFEPFSRSDDVNSLSNLLDLKRKCLYTGPIAHISVAWLGLKGRVCGIKDIFFFFSVQPGGPHRDPMNNSGLLAD